MTKGRLDSISFRYYYFPSRAAALGVFCAGS